jgi:hypothetical protein
LAVAIVPVPGNEFPMSVQDFVGSHDEDKLIEYDVPEDFAFDGEPRTQVSVQEDSLAREWVLPLSSFSLSIASGRLLTIQPAKIRSKNCHG